MTRISLVVLASLVWTTNPLPAMAHHHEVIHLDEFSTASAELNVDVPYSCDVYISRICTLSDCCQLTEKCESCAKVATSTRVKSCGGHRRLTLFFNADEEPVYIHAILPPSNNKCCEEPAKACKQVTLHDGAVKNLTFTKKDFKRSEAGTVFLAVSQPTTTTNEEGTAHGEAAAAEAAATTRASTGLAFDTSKYVFKHHNRPALLAFTRYGAPGGLAKYFTFSKAEGDTPEHLTLTRDKPVTAVDTVPDEPVSVVLQFSWARKNGAKAAEVTLPIENVGFSAVEGVATATVPLRSTVEGGLVQWISEADKPSVIKVSAKLTADNKEPVEVGNHFYIIVKESEFDG